MSLIQKSIVTGIARIFTLPRLSIPLITSLGLTLGAVLCVVAIVSALLLKPLDGVRGENQLYTLEMNLIINNQMRIPYWDFKRLANLNEAFKDMGTWGGIRAARSNVTINDSNLAVTAYTASNNILEILGTNLIKGKDLNVENPTNLVWISNSLWQRQFSGLNSAIDSTIDINGQQYTIAGIIEDLVSIASEEPILNEQVWFIKSLAIELKKAEDTVISGDLPYLLLRSKISALNLPTSDDLIQWQQDFIKSKTLSDQVQPYLNFINNLQQEAKIQSYRDTLLGDSSELMVILFIAVAGLLIMASLNLLNLFIAHYQGRTKEFGVQLSMGASVNRLKMLVFFENLPSMTIATITGLLTAGWIIRALPMIAGNNIPMIDKINLDFTVILSAIIIVILLNLLFSALCLVDINKKALMENLNSSGKGTKGQSNEWISKSLMVIQLSLASVLLTASVMLAFHSYQLVYQDLGYSYDNTREISMWIDDEQWAEKLEDFESFHGSEAQRLEEEISNMLTQEIANSELIIASDGPLTWRLSINIANLENDPDQQKMFSYKRLTPGYFDNFNIPFIAGSDISQAMLNNQESVVVIDEVAAKTFFPDLSLEEVIDKELKLSETSSYRVIGIVSTIKSMTGREMTRQFPVVYRSDNNFMRRMTFLFNLSDDVKIDDLALQQKIQTRFPSITDVRSQTLEDLWQLQTLNQRTSLYMVIGMTMLTMVLAGIGVGGLTQMTTNHRKHELAIRMATGASQTRLLKLLFASTSWLLLIGLGLGFILSVFGYDSVKTYVDRLPEFNWQAMIALDILLLLVVSLAMFWPAWQIIRCDPMQSLREE